MPVTALNALPRAVEQLMQPGLAKTDGGVNDTRAGRYVTIAISLVLLVYAFQFGKALGGAPAGCWAMLLVAIDPNVLAHARLVTTDIYGTTGFIASLFHLYQWLEKKQQQHFYWWCIALAIAQCCKINNVLLYPICFAAIGIYRFYHPRPFSWVLALKQAVIFLVAHYLIINTAFLFYHTGWALEDYTFKSRFFIELQSGWLRSLPLPLPQSFIETFDLTQFERETFAGTAHNYLLGELKYREGFWNYYLLCWLVKTPVITQILILLALFTLLRNRYFTKPLLVFFIAPAAFIVVFLSGSSVQSGYRYLLPVLCLLAIPAGHFISIYRNRFPSTAPWVLSAVLMIPCIISFPNYISYTSEWQWPKKNAYKYLSDSNLNWGQRHKKIGEFMSRHPDYIFDPPQPVTGKIVVDINKLTGIIEPGKYEWLRNNFQPVSVIDGCYLLYEVKELPVSQLLVPRHVLTGDMRVIE
jgi:4-amino-4-deoxy-L-arabinose transferase-like glycosyltransferase